jgi:hypothetical protein
MKLHRLFAPLFALLLASPSAFTQSKGSEQEGIRTVGAVGITERVSDIMARARAFDARGPRAPRMKYEFENEYRRPQQPDDAPGVSSWPPLDDKLRAALQGSVAKAAQTPSTPNFLGAALVDTGAFPPDTMGAVGPTQFIVAVNGRIRSFSKTTGIADGALNADMDVFFNSVMTPPTGSNFTSDPRIRYDRLSGRWFIIIIDVPGGTGSTANRVLVAVSSGATITNASSFTFYQFQMSGSLFADYPTLGIDANALYIGANMFTLAGSFSSTLGTVVNKASLLSGGPITTTTFTLLATPSGAGPFTPQGVDNYDPAATEGYFVGVDNATFSTLMVNRVSNPGGVPTISGNLAVTVPTTTFPARVPHLGNTGGANGQLDALDDRLFAAHVRGGRLWTAHNFRVSASGVASTATGNRVGVRWYELGNLTTTPTLIQAGTVFDNAATNPVHYFIPSIMVSGQGHAALGFSMAGNTVSPNAGTIGRLKNDTLGTTQSPVANYTNSTAAYNPPSDPGGAGGRRWGDYSYTSLDPCDDMTMWTIQEYADATNSYGVRAVRLLAPAPVASNCGAATTINIGAGGTNVALSGAGFFQPAADVGSCRLLLAGSVSGTGVTVNSVTYNSDTSLTLNVSAAPGASTGARSITITNPDGQTTTATGCINVVDPGITLNSLVRSGPAAVCAGGTTSWQAEFSGSVAGVGASNFGLTGGNGASVDTVSGSGTTRSIAVQVGTGAGPLRLDMVNATGVTPTVSGLPFTGESITVNANPSVFSVTGGGVSCSGSGVAVGLSGSEVGVNYQLLRDAAPVGTPVPGTGNALAFGPQSVAGTYTVSASNGSTSCGATMTGNAIVTATTTPTVNAVSPGAICSGTNSNIALASTPGGASFAYTATNTAGTVTGASGGSANPIAQALTGSGSITYAVTATLNTCAGTPTNIVQPVSNPQPDAVVLAAAIEQQAYAANITASGALTSATMAVTAGALPSGITLQSDGGLEGTTSAIGSYTFTVTGTDAGVSNCSATRVFTLDVLARDLFEDSFE